MKNPDPSSLHTIQIATQYSSPNTRTILPKSTVRKRTKDSTPQQEHRRAGLGVPTILLNSGPHQALCELASNCATVAALIRNSNS